MSYVKQDESGSGDTYTLRAAQSGSDVDIQLDAATGSDSDVKLKAGTNITLTEASDTITIDAAGGSPGGSNTQVQFNDGGSFGGDDAFTYDKTNDRVKIGNATIEADNTAKLHIVGTDAGLTVERHDDGSSAGPTLNLLRHSDSPAAGDDTGQVNFRAEDSIGNIATYSSIKSEIEDPTAGSKDGRLTLRTLTNDTQTDAIVIDTKINSEIDHNFKGLIQVNGASGTSGQVLTSQGSGSDPIWAAAGGGGSSLNQALNPRDLLYSVAPSVVDTYLLSRTVGMTCVGSISNSYFTRSSYSQPRFRSFIAPKTGNVSAFLVSVATANASTNFFVGIYSATNGLPDTLLGRAEMDCSSTGEVEQTSITDASGSSATISLTQGEMYFYAWNRTNTSGDPRLHAENSAGTQWTANQVQTMASTDNSYNILDVGAGSSNTLPSSPTANQLYLGGNTSLALRLGIKYS